MHHIKAHVAGTGDAEQGIHVGTIHVEQAAVVVHHFGDSNDLFFEESDSVGVGQHQCGHITVKLAAEIVKVGASFGIAFDGDNFIARKSG